MLLGRRRDARREREGKPRRRTLEIVRGSWTAEAPSQARVEGETVVKIPSFAPGTAANVKTLLATFDRTKPLLLDLRGNARGSFDEAARAGMKLATAATIRRSTATPAIVPRSVGLTA